jgi:molybdate transport system ATP-binding protein
VIEVRLAKRFLATSESPGFALEVEFRASPGVTVLFGGSGAGKTLTLDCIAGFTCPETGRVMLDDRIVYDAAAHVNLRPRDRQCGYVFQNYALFPHMTLRENLAFAAERHPRLERHRKINEMLERFRLLEFAGRYPHEVSGGQKQRCSIARALVSAPRVLLLDEPARGLDAALREDLYALLRELRSELRIPIVLVTHDLADCFSLADLLLVYRDGKIVQAGEPRKVLDRPATPEVARILGVTNLFEAEILALDPGRNSSRLRALGTELTGTYYPGHLRGDRVWLFVPPEDLEVHARAGDNRVPVKLVRVVDRPQTVRLEFLPEIAVEMSRHEYERHRDENDWFVEFPAGSIRVTG